MKAFLLALLVAVYPLTFLVKSSAQKTPPPKPPAEPASQEVETEKVAVPAETPPPISARAGTPGYLEPAQVKALLHKIWLAQYRIDDLLAQVRAERWKMPDAARKSFGQTLENLRKALASEADWRAQFEDRPDSLYLGFQTYVAINAVLPRLDGVARAVSQYENPSFGAQYSQAANQLFDLQQSLQPHLAFLSKNQDGLLLATQTNLASCQNELGYALHNKEGRATPMKNVAPVFKGGKRPHHATEPAGNEKKTRAKTAGAAKPSANPPAKAEQQK
ncbi:MAG: hypothetical protein LAO04_11880 [Acidobacteriia bacterium]|nr:hypothetical protein [Terriglobia bacterium]